MARRKIDQVLRAAALEELRNGTQAREVARKYGIAESTVSRWRQAENIDAGPYVSAVVRSKPLKVNSSPTSESDAASDASAQRREMIRRMVSLVNDLAADGGLKSHDIKNLSQAARVLSEADQREQQLLEEELAKANAAKRPGEIERVPTALGDLTIPNTPHFSDLFNELKREKEIEQEYNGEGLA
jgi:transposase-like protein